MNHINFRNRVLIYFSIPFISLLIFTSSYAQWEVTNVIANNNFREMSFINSQTGWIAAYTGQLYKTTNSGQDWIIQNNPGLLNNYSVHFINSNTGFVGGRASDNFAAISRTTNGGINWSVTNFSIINDNVNSIYFSNLTGWLVTQGSVYKTTNLGTNWINLTVPFTGFSKLYFANNTIGWITGSNIILKTTNGGTNWFTQSVDSFSIRNRFFLNENTGWLTGLRNITQERIVAKTTNGGLNWVKINVPILSTNYLGSVFFINENTGWTCTDGNAPVEILKTTNGGFNWINQSFQGSLQSTGIIYFADEYIGFATDTYGRILNYKPTLVSVPNGAENWNAGINYNIRWISDIQQNVKIEYTTNNGAAWNIIASSIAGSLGNYTWTVPPTLSSQCKIKITDVNNPGIYDESNATFTISLPPRNAQLLKDTIITRLPCYVNVLFHAVNDSNVGIQNLFAEEFKIEEDNVPISPNESRLQVGKANVLNYIYKSVLMLDNSTSISISDLQIIKQAAIGFVRSKLPTQQIALYVFSENTNLLRDFTTDTTLLINSINGIQLGLPSTNLYGSIITGLSRWQDSYSLNNFEFGNLIVLTDGEDTQGSSTLQQVLAARQNKRIITVGLGSQINPGILQQIGNGGYYPVTNINLLISQFATIQQNLIKFLNSFYWLNYTSPKRGNNNHILKISLFTNQNSQPSSYISTVFNSNGFYTVIPGIVVNATPLNPYGVDTLSIPANANELETIEVPFTFNTQPFQFVITNPQLLNIQPGGTPFMFRFIGTALQGQSTNVIINDLVYGYTKTLHIKFGAVGINPISSNVPDKFSLSQNYPNPFNPSTKIKFDIPISSIVKIKLYDLIGKEIKVLVNEMLTPGSYEIKFSAGNLSSGIYYYKIEAIDFVETKKMILIK